MKVKKAIGGVKGCAHLTSLVIAMGESAVQGYWADYGVERGRKGPHEQTIKKFINTCHLWKEDGPIIKRLRETSESEDSSDVKEEIQVEDSQESCQSGTQGRQFYGILK